MPRLTTQDRTKVQSFLLSDLVPEQGYPGKPMEYFENKFSFISDASLRKRLAECWYQARLFEKSRSLIRLQGDFLNAFVKGQILAYASIYEAVIDYMLDKDDYPQLNTALEGRILKEERTAFSSGVKLQRHDASSGSTTPLFVCRRTAGKVRDLKFSERVDLAVSIGFVDANHADFLKQLYDSRNKIHLIAASSKGWSPSKAQSQKAFETLFPFIENVESFAGA